MPPESVRTMILGISDHRCPRCGDPLIVMGRGLDARDLRQIAERTR